MADKKELAELFRRIGLSENVAIELTANDKVTGILTGIIDEAGVANGCDRSVGTLLYKVATEYPSNSLCHRSTVIEYIVSSKINSNAKLAAAFKFVDAADSDDSLKIDDFEKSCGAGVEVSEEEIRAAIDDVLKTSDSGTSSGKLFGSVMEKQPWADPKIVKNILEGMKIKKTETTIPAKKKNKNPENKIFFEKAPEKEEDPFSIFPSPEENLKVHEEIPLSDGRVLRPRNSKSMLEKHLMITKGKVRTRFPPEPNGYLHIGHAKAMFVDFGLAKNRGGECYLRFDDTNPEAEKEEYINHIEEIVSWMGWEPVKITYTSDYFQQLYDYAVELIKRGFAYVDEQTPEEVKDCREKMINSPCRDRSVEESLKLFEDMKLGKIKEGKATLRMKQDMQNDNVNMRDLIAYRIKLCPHPRTGEEWKIYPSYDFAHCIVDSLENITHSLCTLEFETRRAPYYWLLDALGLYLPHVREYSRLNVAHTVLSKRKLIRLVSEKHVNGWDDPQLMTLSGLRRRGVTSTAINSFVRKLGISRSDVSLISTDKLENCICTELSETAPRAMVVLKPLKVVITNMERGAVIDLDGRRPSSLSFYNACFASVVYIEETDFKEEDSDNYHGLALGKWVRLRYAFPIKCTEVVKDEDGKILRIEAEYDPDPCKKKLGKNSGVLHWVAEPSPGVDPLKVEVRLYDKLFMSENPAEKHDKLSENRDKWLEDLNPRSRDIVSDAVAVSELRAAKPGDVFQFERLGYFAVDEDTTPEKLVFNRTVAMKDRPPC